MPSDVPSGTWGTFPEAVPTIPTPDMSRNGTARACSPDSIQEAWRRRRRAPAENRTGRRVLRSGKGRFPKPHESLSAGVSDYFPQHGGTLTAGTPFPARSPTENIRNGHTASQARLLLRSPVFSDKRSDTVRDRGGRSHRTPPSASKNAAGAEATRHSAHKVPSSSEISGPVSNNLKSSPPGISVRGIRTAFPEVREVPAQGAYPRSSLCPERHKPASRHRVPQARNAPYRERPRRTSRACARKAAGPRENRETGAKPAKFPCGDS